MSASSATNFHCPSRAQESVDSPISNHGKARKAGCFLKACVLPSVFFFFFAPATSRRKSPCAGLQWKEPGLRSRERHGPERKRAVDSGRPNEETTFYRKLAEYRKTPLISTYVFSGLATEQVLIFGAVLTFGGYDKADAKILQGRSLFNPVLSAHNTLLCRFQRLCTYFQDTGELIFGGMYFRGIATNSKFQ